MGSVWKMLFLFFCKILNNKIIKKRVITYVFLGCYLCISWCVLSIVIERKKGKDEQKSIAGHLFWKKRMVQNLLLNQTHGYDHRKKCLHLI